MQELKMSVYTFRIIDNAHFRSSCDDFARRNLNLLLIPFLMLMYDFLVETENNEGAGSDGSGGRRIGFVLPCCARYFSYSENDKLLLADIRFRSCCGLWLELSNCSFEDLEVIPVEALPCDPDEAVL